MLIDPLKPTIESQMKAIEWLGSNYIDVGCGPNPLPGAKVYYDVLDWPGIDIYKINFYEEKLPILGNIYCRHVLEDLYYPPILLDQFKNCERGYIEIPSITVEIAKGVDQHRPWRGFAHHHWFIWEENGTLIFCPKSNVIEHVIETGYVVEDIPLELFSNIYKWENYNLKYKILYHDINFDIRLENYIMTIYERWKIERDIWASARQV